MNNKLFIAATVLLASAFCSSASAEAGKIGIVSVDRVFKDYKGTQSKEAEFQKVAEVKQAAREKKVAEIRNMRDELALLNDENREKQRQSIELKLRDLAAFDQEAKNTLGEMREEAISALLKEIEQVVDTLAKSDGYDLILSDRATLYRVDSYDLTGKVTSILNERLGKGGKGA